MCHNGGHIGSSVQSLHNSFLGFSCFPAFFFSKPDFLLSVPPRIQKPGETHRSLTIDERVSLLCSVIEGDEPITMIWLKNGANISDSMEAEVNFVGHDSILRINKLGEHHIGNYSCRASNPAGDTDIFFFVEVKGTF